MPFLIPLLALLSGVGATAYVMSDDENGVSFIDEATNAARDITQDLLVTGVVFFALNQLPISKRNKIIIGAGYSAYLIAKITKEETTGKSVIEKAIYAD